MARAQLSALSTLASPRVKSTSLSLSSQSSSGPPKPQIYVSDPERPPFFNSANTCWRQPPTSSHLLTCTAKRHFKFRKLKPILVFFTPICRTCNLSHLRWKHLVSLSSSGQNGPRFFLSPLNSQHLVGSPSKYFWDPTFPSQHPQYQRAMFYPLFLIWQLDWNAPQAHVWTLAPQQVPTFWEAVRSKAGFWVVEVVTSDEFLDVI